MRDAPVDSPADAIVKTANKTARIMDARNRAIVIKKLTALERMRLFACAGPELSKNEQWIGLAALAASVVELEGEPVPKPNNRREIEFLVERLDDDGLTAVGEGYIEHFGMAPNADEGVKDTAKN
jgi:hypothetical protein